MHAEGRAEFPRLRAGMGRQRLLSLQIELPQKLSQPFRQRAPNVPFIHPGEGTADRDPHSLEAEPFIALSIV